MKRAALFGILTILSWAPNAEANNSPRCESLYVNVAVSPTDPENQAIFAEYCAPSHGPVKAVQVLIHGGSYDHRYWDPPAEISRHSYVRHANRSGYATLNLDRVGVGLSSRPLDPSNLDLHAGAYTMHQLVQKLRNGSIQTARFGTLHPQTILLVGFSLGAFISTIESSTYDDVDGLILQSYSHVIGPAAEASFTLAYPANLEPRFSGLHDEYFTTVPGARPQLFFFENGLAPEVLTSDEVLKQTYTLAELTDIFPSLGASFGVTAPTFLVVGDYDLISCEAPSCSVAGSLAGEASAFPATSSFTFKVIPNAGHTLNWHNAAPTAFRAMTRWADDHFGPQCH